MSGGIDREVRGGIAVVRASGELDVACVDDLRAALSQPGARPDLIVDLSLVTFVDSSVLGVLVRALRRAREAGGGLWLVVSAPSVLGVLAVTNLDAIMNVRSDLDQTLAEITATPAPRRVAETP